MLITETVKKQKIQTLNISHATSLSCRDCVLEENLLISRGTSVGGGTVISNSVIGRNCVIGKKKP